MQYFHFRGQVQGTLCIEVPDKKWLEMFFAEHGNHTIVPIGITVKSNLDQFVKKLGRETALKRINHLKVELEKVFIRGTKHFYVFRSPVMHNYKDYSLTFHVSTVKESNLAFLTHAELRENG